MTYNETINYLYNSTPVFEHVGASAYKEGLYNSLELDKHFKYPHRKYKCIHIAGTNGKGSTSHTLASILQEEGYKVGLFTSPHLIDFRERIRVNGEMISEDYVVKFVEEEKYFFEPLHPSFFELTTAMALKYFADEHIDIAIIEVGLGGRLDCTNIITPILSIITNIGLDHTNLLGNTIEMIAKEKAGIIKKNIPVIIGETPYTIQEFFKECALEKNTDIYFAEKQNEIIKYEYLCNGLLLFDTYTFQEFIFPLAGNYQIKNVNTILQAVKILIQLQIIKNKDSVKKGLTNVINNTKLMGRWQILQSSPTIICDTGHNIDAWKYLSKQLILQKALTLRIIFGMVDDKDINSIMKLLPSDAVYYFTQATNKRSINAQEVAKLGTYNHLKGTVFLKVEEAYQKALSEADPNDLIFVGGSSYIVADLLTFLHQNKLDNTNESLSM